MSTIQNPNSDSKQTPTEWLTSPDMTQAISQANAELLAELQELCRINEYDKREDFVGFDTTYDELADYVDGLEAEQVAEYHERRQHEDDVYEGRFVCRRHDPLW